MRELKKILLSACTVCALGQAQHAARADTSQPDQVPPPQNPPAANPPQTPPSTPGDASPESSNPGDTPSDASGTTSPAPNPPEATPTTPAGPGEDTTPPPTATQPPAAPPPTATQQTATTQPPATTQQTTTTTTTTTYPGAPEPESGESSNAWSEPALASGVGISVLVGGGATGFVKSDMRDITSDVGGLWDVRLTIGSHVPLALDLSYVGSALKLNDLPAGDTGWLIGSAAEGALRWNVMPHNIWTPYVFGGVGWQRYDVTGLHDATRAAIGMAKHDNLLEVPAGAGLSYRMNRFVFDLRGTYRFTWYQDLVPKTLPTTTTSDHSNFAKMDTWEGSAAIGYEF